MITCSASSREALGKLPSRTRACPAQRECPTLNSDSDHDADYEKSRVIADPLRLLDCVMFCDGANAFLVTTEQKARSLGSAKWCVPTAYAEVTNFNGNQPLSEITETGFSKVAPRVYKQSGLTLKISTCSSPTTIHTSRCDEV